MADYWAHRILELQSKQESKDDHTTWMFEAVTAFTKDKIAALDEQSAVLYRYHERVMSEILRER
jgi:hypothetical protein